MPDVVVAGAGLIGLSCALECDRRGLSVTVLERGEAVRQASWAAAGMLAAHDPANPAALRSLAEFSIELYPRFLDRLRALCGIAVPLETEWVLEEGSAPTHNAVPANFQGEHFEYIHEQSLDPRKLTAAVLQAVRTSGIELREHTPVEHVESLSRGAVVRTHNDRLACGAYLDCTGAWSAGFTHPTKGQMVRVSAPGTLAVPGRGNVVVRTDDIYMVPRLDGSVIIGATVENAGFDRSLHDADLDALRLRAASLLPSVADAPELERWSGLRPDTPDHLPFLGQTGSRTFMAAGHFRNGVLLAPATARVMADLILGTMAAVDLEPFSPWRCNAPLQHETAPGAVFEQV